MMTSAGIRPAQQRNGLPPLQCNGLVKTYGTTTVVSDASLTVREGEILSLVGANGAGKSTVLGMLSGRTSPTSGSISILGATPRFGNPKWSRKHGIATVYQELTIIPGLTAVANVFLGSERARLGFLTEAQMTGRFLALCSEFELDIPPKVLASQLSVATHQVLEIMRAINVDAKVMLFDEPTAALSQAERDNFLTILTKLASRGVAIVLVSHNLGEVLAVSDTVTVMRSGAIVATRPASAWSRTELIDAMTGEATPVSVQNERPRLGEVVLDVTGLQVPHIIDDLSLTVRSGEIVGIAGLVGAGRSTLLRSIAGAESSSSGTMTVDGSPVRWPRSVRDAVHRLSIAIVPEERKAEGIHLHLGIADNVTLPQLSRFSAGPVVMVKRQQDWARTIMTTMKLSRPMGDYPVSSLSGGNQQKVAIAKWLTRRPRVLLFDEPTRGIDVGAKVHVMTAIRQYAREGHAVIVTSSELEEVLDISDRLLVLSRGAVVAEHDMHTNPPTLSEVVQQSFTRTG